MVEQDPNDYYNRKSVTDSYTLSMIGVAGLAVMACMGLVVWILGLASN